MRRTSRVETLGLLGLCLGGLLVGGCQDASLSGTFPVLPGVPTPPQTTQAPDNDPQAEAIAAEAQALAERVASASGMAHQSFDQPQPVREILWRDLAAEPATSTASSTSHKIQPAAQPSSDGQTTSQAVGANTNALQPPVTAGSNLSEPTTPQVVTVSHPDTQAVQKLSTRQAFEQLINAIRRSDDSYLSKAVAAATLAAAQPYGELDWSMLAPLSPADQERVQRYHRAVSSLYAQALSGDGTIDEQQLNDTLTAVLGEQPVTIRRIELCEKVQGYGVYDAFPERTFVAGRPQKLIVYVELDHFQPTELNDGSGFEVRLKQELELYESNGYEVWSHEPVPIVDVSRNKRRDFFVVQLVTLPANLALGQYHLKVRVFDEHGGTRDEASVPIRIVADESLVSRTRLLTNP